jgi:hypothetical protein
MAKKKTPQQPSLEEVRARYIAQLMKTDPARAAALEKLAQKIDQAPPFLFLDAAKAKLDSYRGTVIPITELVKSLADAGFTMAGKKMDGTWVYLRPDQVEEFINSGEALKR